MKDVIPSKYIDENTVYHMQPSGRFVIGGPQVGGGSPAGCSIIFNCFVLVLIVFLIISVILCFHEL